MSSSPSTTVIKNDGLKYKSKVSGSPFGTTTFAGTATMSCFLCGKHRAREFLKMRKLVGKYQSVCSPSCADVPQ